MTPTQALILATVFLIYVLVFYFLGRRSGFPALAGILLALLVHEWIIRWLTSLFEASPLVVTAASLWKDGALAGLGLVWLRRRMAQLPEGGVRALWSKAGILEGLLILVVAVGVISALLSPNRLAGIMAFRDYFEPILVFFLLGAIWPEPRQLRGLVRIWLAVLAVMALLGITQTLFWSADDYVRWGFGVPQPEAGIPTVGLRGGIQVRAPSTVTGPNELGMHMVLGLLTVNQLILTPQKQRWPLLALGLLFGVALVLTFSRSDLIAYLVGLAAAYWLRRRDRASILGHGTLLNAIVLGVMLVAVLQSGMLGHVAATAANLEGQFHVQDTSVALEVLLDNPGGVGMGLVGPRSGAFFPEQPAFHVEGSVFQIAFEMGIWGLGLWALFAVVIGVWAVRGWRRAEVPLDRAMVGTALGGGLGLSFVLLFLPLMQSMPLMSWMWFLLGYAVHLGRRPVHEHGSLQS